MRSPQWLLFGQGVTLLLQVRRVCTDTMLGKSLSITSRAGRTPISNNRGATESLAGHAFALRDFAARNCFSWICRAIPSDRATGRSLDAQENDPMDAHVNDLFYDVADLS